MDNKEPIILRTYSSVWKIENKIYSIDTIKLLFPVKPSELIYFFLSLLINYFLLKLLPFLDGIPFIFKWVVVPYLLMKFLTKQKLDGKLPHKFFIDYMIFKLGPKKFSKFQPVEEYKKIKFTTLTGKRDKKIINKTEEALKEKKKSFFSFSKKSDNQNKKEKVKEKKKKKSSKFEKGTKMRERF